ncbi:hypothetical protein [Pandoraea apista]|uniref:hypothetical protein n=1 Tax=Pandoraea apista TaxID=93218 RepID=UPI000F675407|nr:hypothetical protein [Pandoraea apista]RRW91042.1 hypothetical protein EGJ54_21620 [Pandoraea apista]RRX00833.1 hypothetical protein EGJ56_18280 [Pandoraea apista]
MATEKVRVLKIDHEEITTKKGDKRPMRVLHCFVEQSYQDAKTGKIVDGSFVAKTSVFDENVELAAGEEYLVEYRLGEGYGMDAGRMVPRIAAWRSMKQKPVAKPAATTGA